ncbi:MAG: protein kinase [Myxococcota bacterium]|nr:protein kinase [Myxococcota bacterium]
MADDIMCPKCTAPNPKETVFCGKCGERLISGKSQNESADPLIGSFVGDRFLVHEKLGEGGMGVVYRAEQTAIKRPVALKVLHATLTQDESLHARFHNEAAASSRLTHPNTVTIYDFGRTDSGSLYIAMEFIEGKSLDDEIQEKGPLAWRRASQIAGQICDSLSDAHSHNIVHRDLKPENVMLCKRGGKSDFVKVLDFGIAKMLEDDGTDQRQALTKTGMVFGTPQYMSPEQIRGEKVDHRSDIYSLGVILYQVLTGQLPFTADTPMGVLSKHLVDTPPKFRDTDQTLVIPDAVEAVVMAALAKKPEDRPQTMAAFAQQLSNAAQGAPSESKADKQPIAATMVTATPGQSGSTQAGPPASLPPTQVSPQMPGGAVVPVAKQRSGRLKGILIVAILLVGGVAVAWYLVAGSAGSGSDAPSPAAVASTAPPPLQVQPILPTGTQDTAPATSPTPETNTGSLPAVPETDPKPNPSNSGNKPTQPKDVKCKFIPDPKGDAVGLGVLAHLRKQEKGIKKCARLGANGKTLFQYTVKKGARGPISIRPRMSEVPAQVTTCLKSLISGDIGLAADKQRRGTAAFDLNFKKGAVRTCRVTAAATPVAIGNIVKPPDPPEPTTGEAEQNENESSDPPDRPPFKIRKKKKP